VLDRTKEPGATGEPLYQDVVTPLEAEAVATEIDDAAVIGGRYGLSSKEFTPAMVKAVFDELAKDEPKNALHRRHHDDVTALSLEVDPTFTIEPDDVVRAMFYGLGSDGTVGANKNSIKIIGEDTDNLRAGLLRLRLEEVRRVTVSHLRFGPRPIRSTYLISRPTSSPATSFVFLEKYDVLESRPSRGTFLLNSPYGPDEVWDSCPRGAGADHRQEAQGLRRSTPSRRPRPGMGGASTRSCRPASSRSPASCPATRRSQKIKDAIKKTYGKKGEEVVRKNFAAVDQALRTCTR
jgi:pyruvate-ferredoxin/flavodoxin oxidoreductase